MGVYRTLFRADLQHSYYTDGYARGLQLVPHSDTQLTFRNGRMLWKKWPTGFKLTYESPADTQDPVINMGRDQLFVFGLFNEDPHFLSVTDLNVRQETPVNPATNQAEGKTATASSEQNGTDTADKAVDGNANSFWRSGDADDQWWQVDLGAVYRCVEIQLKWKKKAKEFQLMVSEDGRRWASLLHETDNNSNNHNVTGLAAPARYVRVQCDESDDNSGFGFKEVEVYADTQIDIVPWTSGKIIYYRNTPASASHDTDAPEQVVHDLLDRIVPESFVFAYTVDSFVDTVVQVTDPVGNTFMLTGPDDNTATIKPGNDGVYRHPVFLKNKPEGLYQFTVKTTDEVTTLGSQKIYFNNQFAVKPVLGIVEFLYQSAQDEMYGDPEYYGLVFNRKETFWKYHVINKSGQLDFTDAELEIQDESGDSGDPYLVYEFIKGKLLESNPDLNGLDSITFNSRRPIPIFQSPKLSLELKNTAATDPVIISNLPNAAVPGQHEQESNIYIYV
ncbi:MAG: discoidin domain-containing protein [Flavobacteriales bacterium]|nr:discoidin domain-containing protein [Flavobacteriales bacterium]MCB9448591.1 discoidin domain-containing protein [Flavobacteriales bacterium]